MRIGLIGSGHIGGTLARLMVDAGFEVVLSNSRGPDTLSVQVAELGPLAAAGTVGQAAASGELVVVTIPLKAYRAVPAGPLVGKIVVDTNNYYPDRDGPVPELQDGSTTSSELLAAHLPGARVVKAFNSIQFQQLATQGQPAGSADRRALPIAGDDAGAKAVVAGLIEAFGFDVVDVGPLSQGRRFQPGTPAYNIRLTADQLRSAVAAP
jgi:8-hydroxy-5-deazaflavin:NADPH oxidoreductase